MNESPPGNKERRDKRPLAIAFFSQIGMTMAACVLIGVFVGKGLDSLLGTAPWLLLVFSALGVGASIKSLFDMGMGK